MRASAERAIRVATARPRDRAKMGERRGKTKSASETTDDGNELFRVDLFARAQPR